MRRSELSRREAVGFVQQHHHTAHSGRRNERTEEFPLFLLAGRGAEPIADFQVSDKGARHGQSRADHAAHNQRSHHAARALQSDAHHHHRGQNQRHQRHTRHGIRAHNGNGIGCHCSKEERDERHHDDGHQRMEHITVHHAKPEEQERDENRDDRSDGDELKREVALGALRAALALLAALHFLRRQSHGTLDDAPRLDDADDAGHCDAADANRLAVGLENFLGRHLAHCRRDVRIPLVEHRVGEQQGHSGHDEPPHRQRPQTDNQRVLKTDDVAQSEHRRTRVHLEDELRLVGQLLTEANNARREILVPEAERGHEEVIQSAHDSSHQQGFGLVAALRTAHEHLRGGRSLGEGVFSVHLAHEILAERNQEQDADDAAQERRNENIDKRGRHLGIFRLKDVDGRQRENGTCHHGARAGANRLDDDVLAQCLAALCRRGYAHGNDGNRDGRLEHLAHFQPQIGRSRRKQHRHQHAPRHRPGVHLRIITLGRHQRFVALALFQLSKRILRQSGCHFLFFFHVLYDF